MTAPESHGRVLRIVPATDAAPLSPEQKRFNTLVRQIDDARRALVAWHDGVALHARAHARKVVPLERALADAQREWVFALDALLVQPGWSRDERATLGELIRDGAAQLLDAVEGVVGQEHLAALKALHDRHAEVDFDTGQRQAREAMKDLAERMTGLDLGDMAGIDSGDDLLRRLHETLAAQAGAGKPREGEEAGDDGARARAEAASPARPQRRRKPPSAAQKQREAEAQLATQSVREVFRRLASALHPDREADAARREAKTALMQKANQAYASGDLLALLELQFEIEQIDAAHLATAGAQRLKHYNQVLAGQLAELKAEVGLVEARFRTEFGLPPGRGLNPQKLTRLVDDEARLLRADAADCRGHLRLLDDRAATRRWLKDMRRRLREAAKEDDGPFFS